VRSIEVVKLLIVAIIIEGTSLKLVLKSTKRGRLTSVKLHDHGVTVGSPFYLDAVVANRACSPHNQRIRQARDGDLPVARRSTGDRKAGPAL
jgi:hypothetical protein